MRTFILNKLLRLGEVRALVCMMVVPGFADRAFAFFAEVSKLVTVEALLVVS